MDHNRQVHILPRENQQQSHEQAVNMAAAAAKGSRGGYDMGQRPSHVGHIPQQPIGHPIQQQIHQNPS